MKKKYTTNQRLVQELPEVLDGNFCICSKFHQLWSLPSLVEHLINIEAHNTVAVSNGIKDGRYRGKQHQGKLIIW